MDVTAIHYVPFFIFLLNKDVEGSEVLAVVTIAFVVLVFVVLGAAG